MAELKELIQKAGVNANEHGWKIRWNPMMMGNLEEVQKGYRYLSIGEALALMHSEISEMLEAYRDDDKTHFAEELSDLFIRGFHLAHDVDIDLESSITTKMAKNKTRPKNHGRKNL